LRLNERSLVGAMRHFKLTWRHNSNILECREVALRID
jgi:hypothetical protein